MADVLNCQLVKVGGRSYRVQSTKGQYTQQEGYYYEDEENYNQACEDVVENVDDIIDDSLITKEGDKFVTKYSADPEVFSYIIGRQGQTKKRIEQETSTTIIVPSKRDQQGPPGPRAPSTASDVIIKGDTKAAISRARTQLELVVESALSGRRLEYTHFACLPLNAAGVADKLEAFKRQVLALPGAAAQGYHESIFIGGATLHLTLAMMKLYSDEKRYKAQQVLQGLGPQLQSLLGGRPLTVRLKGLDSMNDDPSAMHVVYLKAEEVGGSRRLDQLCGLVVRSLSQAGLLLRQDDRPVLIHATIINTRHRSTADDSSPGSSDPQNNNGDKPYRDRIPVDGRTLMQRFSDLDLGEITIPALHLSQRFKKGPDGFYYCLAKVDLK